LKRTICIVGMSVSGIALIWAFLPIRSYSQDALSGIPAVSDQPPAQQADVPVDSVDPRVFAEARLWNPVPSPITEAPKEETRTVARPKLDLIGIIDENGERFAAIQIQDTGLLLILKEGEELPPFTVKRITNGEVLLEDGHSVTRLAIARDQTGGRK